MHDRDRDRREIAPESMSAPQGNVHRSREERIIGWLGSCTSWALLVLMGVIVTQVVLRYGFNYPVAALSELQRHLYALLVMVAISYAGIEGAHVRVDLLYDRLSATAKNIVTVIAQWLLLVPLAAFIFYNSVHFAWESFRIGETSPAPGGLPFRWLVKSLIPLGTVLVLLGAIGEGWRAARHAVRGE